MACSETGREAWRVRRLFQRAAFAELANIHFQLVLAAQARLDETSAKESNIRLSPEWPPSHIGFNFWRNVKIIIFILKI